MVRVSRDVTEPSGFFVCVAESEESIRESLEVPERLPNLRYHCTPKGAPPETAGQIRKLRKLWGEDDARRAGPGELKTYLLTIIVITSNMARNPRRWVMIDIRKSEERGPADHGWLKTHFTFSL